MMRTRLIAALFMLTLLVSAAPAAHADTFTLTPQEQQVIDANNQAQQQAQQQSAQVQQQTSAAIQAEGQTTAADQQLLNQQLQASAPASIPLAAANSPTSLTSSNGPGLDDPLDYIMVKLMTLFAWLLGIAAITLDNAMYYTVVHMGSYVNGLSAVGVAWRILRDIGNIIILFGFIMIGLETILDLNFYGGGTKMLPKLLIAAVFLNFSLFVAEAVIDTGNLFATEFYTQINGGVASAPVDYSSTSISNEGISTAVMNQLGLQGFYSGGVGANNSNVNAIFQNGHPFIIGFLALLIFVIATFVFFSLAFILIARFVYLVFLIIIAPVGFAGLGVPRLDKFANKWWQDLFDQTITAPVMLLMLYVALAVITDSKFLTGFGVNGSGSGASGAAQNAWVAAATSATGTNIGALASVLLSFLVAMGLLLAVVMLSKELGAKGGAWATSIGGKVTGGIIGYGFLGGTALAGRSTLGLGGRLLNSKRMQKAASTSTTAAALVGTGRFLANRTYDARNIGKVPGLRTASSIVGGTIGGALAAGGAGSIALGKGTTATAQQTAESTQKMIKEYKPFSGDWWREQQKTYDKAAADIKRKENLADTTKPAFITTLKKMSADELAALRDIRKGEDAFVQALSPAKYAELQKSDKLLAGEKDNLKNAWNAQFDSTKNDPAKTLGRFTTDEIASLDGDLLEKKDVAKNLGQAELEAIRRRGNLTLSQRKAIKTALSDASAPKAKEFTEYRSDDKDRDGNRKKYWDVS